MGASSLVEKIKMLKVFNLMRGEQGFSSVTRSAWHHQPLFDHFPPPLLSPMKAAAAGEGVFKGLCPLRLKLLTGHHSWLTVTHSFTVLEQHQNKTLFFPPHSMSPLHSCPLQFESCPGWWCLPLEEFQVYPTIMKSQDLQEICSTTWIRNGSVE